MSYTSDQAEELIELTATIVSAYVANNSVPIGQLPGLISDVHQSLGQLGSGGEAETPTATPAVSVKRSITPDYLICLDDGLKFKSMKRHLGMLGMTPEQYRAKWNLPADYPMVAPNYAAQRSVLAKSFGLGKKALATVAVKEKRKVGRPRKASPSI